MPFGDNPLPLILQFVIVLLLLPLAKVAPAALVILTTPLVAEVFDAVNVMYLMVLFCASLYKRNAAPLPVLVTFKATVLPVPPALPSKVTLAEVPVNLTIG